VGWDGEGRERKGEEGRDGKRAGGKYCFMAVGGMDATAFTSSVCDTPHCLNTPLATPPLRGGVCYRQNRLMLKLCI
jgi:hypothetical protein